MRQNPTAATGPVSIKHVRNTVPTKLPAAATPSGVLTTTISGTLSKPAFDALMEKAFPEGWNSPQRETPTL